MILDIVKYPSSLLREKCAPVQFNDISFNIKKLVVDMAETMYAAPGVGLAGPQVGVLKRIVIIDITRDPEQKNLITFINPQIICAEGEIAGEEGCLSLPEVWGEVKRSRVVRVKYFDLAGKECDLTCEDYLARAVQHEVDHLNGVLFIDHLSKIKRDFIKTKLRKKVKLTARG